MRTSKTSRAARQAPSEPQTITEPTEPNPEATATEPAAPPPPAAPRLRLDDSAMKSSYANFTNATSTRDETALTFGMVQAFDRAQNEIPVQLDHRIVMTPFVARRLSRMLISLLQNYEARFGPLAEDAR